LLTLNEAKDYPERSSVRGDSGSISLTEPVTFDPDADGCQSNLREGPRWQRSWSARTLRSTRSPRIRPGPTASAAVAGSAGSASGAAKSAAVVDGRVPVGETDKEDGVDGLGGLCVAEPDRFPAFLAAGAHPRGEAAQGFAVVHDHGLMKRCLPARRSCPPDFGAVIAAAGISFATCRTVSARRLS
jgi:hypothetical protein